MHVVSYSLSAASHDNLFHPDGHSQASCSSCTEPQTGTKCVSPLLRLPNWGGSLSTEGSLQPWSEEPANCLCECPSIAFASRSGPAREDRPYVSVRDDQHWQLIDCPPHTKEAIRHAPHWDRSIWTDTCGRSWGMLRQLRCYLPFLRLLLFIAHPLPLISLAFHPFPFRPNLHKPLIATHPRPAQWSHKLESSFRLPCPAQPSGRCSCWQAPARACR